MSRPRLRKGTKVYRYLLPAVAVALLAGEARAQFIQYGEPGRLQRPDEPQDARALARAARWRLGPVSLDPLLSVRDVGWIENLYATPDDGQQISDFRATVGAGLVSYLPLGRRLLLTGFLLPEYVWWDKREELRQLNWNSGLRGQAQFNRLTLTVLGRRVERDQFLNSEVEVPVEILTETAAFSFELDPRGPFAVFGSVGTTSSENRSRDTSQIPAAGLEALDREAKVARLGIEYLLGNGLTIGLGYELSETEFTDPAATRSNESAGPVLEVRFEGARVDVLAEAVGHSVEFDVGPDREEIIGGARVTFEISPKLGLTPYAQRRLVYSARDSQDIFLEERYGLSAGFAPNSRFRFSVFFDRGESEFQDVTSDAVARTDEIEAYGAGLEVTLSRRLTLGLSAAHIDYRSDLPELDRTTARVTSQVRVTGFDLIPE